MLSKLRAALERRRDKLGAAGAGDSPAPDHSDEVAQLRTAGNSHLASSEYGLAENLFREAVALDPTDYRSLVCLGFALKEQKQLAEARVVLRRAVQHSQRSADAFETHYLYGLVCDEEQDLAQARAQYEESLRLKPDFTLACRDLCGLLERQGNAGAIRGVLERLVAIAPKVADYRVWLADVCESEGNFEGVVEHLTVAVNEGRTNAQTELLLGAALCRIGDVVLASIHLERAETAEAGLAADVQYHLGYYYVRSGQMAAGVRHLDRCVSLRPQFDAAHSLLLLALTHGEEPGLPSYKEAALRYANMVDLRLQKTESAAWQIDSHVAAGGGKLKIGFVSGDLYRHPVAHFLKGVIEHMDRERFHLVSYSNNAHDDELTVTLRGLFDEWHTIRQLNDDSASNLIRGHAIDVLIDLGGHTGESRVSLFGRRQAPTQLSWLGYFASTGLRQMDYVLSDPVSTPLDSSEWFSEHIHRLPHIRLCMTSPEVGSGVPIQSAPMPRSGHVTLGCFQQVSKISPKVLAVWSRALQLIPAARLRIQAAGLDTPSIQARLLSDMREAGIDLTRVVLVGSQKLEDYLESHNEVDFLLDTFPFPGGTTTAFALYMGVPTVTLSGATMLARQGAAMLKCVGLDDWIAHSESEYLDTCIRMSNSVHTLDALRTSLRETALASPLFDSARFAGDFGAALELMHAQSVPARDLQ